MRFGAKEEGEEKLWFTYRIGGRWTAGRCGSLLVRVRAAVLLLALLARLLTQEPAVLGVR